MKAKILSVAATVLILAAPSCKKHAEAENSFRQTVDVAHPITDSIVLHKSYPGILTAHNEIDIVARVNGTLESMNYESGQFVSAGTVLFTIESTQYRDDAARAHAALETALAQQQYARSHYDALSRALESDAVSRDEVEQGRSSLESANAAVETARANLNSANTNLGYCSVRAPLDGHISNNLIAVGSYIGGEGAPVKLATLYDNSLMTANFSIDDASLIPLLANMLPSEGLDFHAIPVSFNDELQHTYTADLNYLAPAVNTSTGTVALQARIANPYNELRSGMYVSVDLPTGVAPHATLVKTSAISRDQRGSYLYTVDDSSKVVYTPITLGQAVNDSLTIVTQGITPDQVYITRALLKVRPGMTVNKRITE